MNKFTTLKGIIAPLPLQRKLKIFVFIVITTLSAYINSAQAMEPIANGTKLGWEGLNFYSPNYGDWLYEGKDHAAVFGKKDSETHSILAQIQYSLAPKVSSPEEFLDLVKKNFDKDNNDARYSVDFNQTVLDKKFGKHSVKMQRRYRDKGAVNKQNYDFLMIEDYSYVFIHPHNSEVLVTVVYSERFKPGEQTNTSIKEREEFVNNIKPF